MKLCTGSRINILKKTNEKKVYLIEINHGVLYNVDNWSVIVQIRHKRFCSSAR